MPNLSMWRSWPAVIATGVLVSACQPLDLSTAEGVAAASGTIPDRDLGRVAAGPSISPQDSPGVGLGYTIRAYREAGRNEFRIGLTGQNMSDLISVVDTATGANLDFRTLPERAAGAVWVTVPERVYARAIGSGLTLAVTRDETVALEIPARYFAGFDAIWRQYLADQAG